MICVGAWQQATAAVRGDRVPQSTEQKIQYVLPKFPSPCVQTEKWLFCPRPWVSFWQSQIILNTAALSWGRQSIVANHDHSFMKRIFPGLFQQKNAPQTSK